MELNSDYTLVRDRWSWNLTHYYDGKKGRAHHDPTYHVDLEDVARYMVKQECRGVETIEELKELLNTCVEKVAAAIEVKAGTKKTYNQEEDG